MSKSKILLGRGSPRSDIKIVESLNGILPCDKLIPRFIPEFKAYQMMRQYFLDHKEYTHLVLATDDIVVKPKHVTQLIKDIEKFDYPVISGMMNVDQGDEINVNLTRALGMKNRRLRAYKWIKRIELPDEDIFQVAFSGFPLMAIKREIVKDYIFQADRVFEGKPPDRGASLDFVFCWYCQDHNIPVMVDQRIDMKHLRKEGTMKLDKTDRLFIWKCNEECVQIKL